MQDLTALLSASAVQLRSLDLWYPTYAPQIYALDLSSDIRQLSQLTSLTWGQNYTPVSTENVVAMLQGLPMLQHLSLAGLVSDLGEFTVKVATSCPRLTSLHISQNQRPMQAPLVVSEFGLLTNLVELNLHHMLLGSLPDSISRLTSLQRLSIMDDDISITLPMGLTACQQLSRLHMMSDMHSPVLGQLTALQQLDVYVLRYYPQHSMSWPKLTALRELELRFEVKDDWRVNEIPSELAGMTGLRKLTISHAERGNISDIPEGPYLHGLETLCLYDCSFLSGLPGHLAAATQLRHLTVTLDFYTSLDTFFRILGCLQALETLSMSHLERVHRSSWKSALKQFNGECIALGRKPPVIEYK